MAMMGPPQELQRARPLRRCWEGGVSCGMGWGHTRGTDLGHEDPCPAIERGVGPTHSATLRMASFGVNPIGGKGLIGHGALRQASVSDPPGRRELCRCYTGFAEEP